MTMRTVDWTAPRTPGTAAAPPQGARPGVWGDLTMGSRYAQDCNRPPDTPQDYIARIAASEIRAAMNGHICRCGTYPRVMQAIKLAARVMAGETP